MWLLFLLIAFSATLFGAVTGMGGGVFIKPLLDLVGQQDMASISVLSSATVFVMSGVTLFKARKSSERPDAKISIPLSIGAVCGGVMGERIFATLAVCASPSGVITVQNTILIGLIVLVFIYMLVKSNLPSLHLNGKLASIAVGLVLGMVSSFLGIGGGPINVAGIMFLFSFSTKMAMQCSLLTILFSQAAKILTVMLSANVCEYDLSVLPIMIVGGVAGGLLGGVFHTLISTKVSEILFGCAQIIVICICFINILNNR